jgi:pyruvate/2-oxoglutarate/acetoin dehydrogenase E1 component
MSAEQMTYAKAINAALRVAMSSDPTVFVAGEDIGVYGGAFGVTDGLLAEFGAERVRDTPISEDAIVGMGIGAAITGMKPVVEMQFSDFVVNAMDAIVNQAAKLHFMYGGNVTVPMVIRLPGGGGTGAAEQHSQSLEAWFAHVPGLKVYAPSSAQDAHDLLLAAINDPNPVVFIEHKLLYKDDGPVELRASLDAVGPDFEGTVTRREGADLTIVAYSRNTPKSLEAAEALAAEGIEASVLDLRSLRPLDLEPVIASVERTGRLLVTHEAPGPVGIGAEVIAGVAESRAFDHLLSPPRRVVGGSNPMPYAPALERATIPQVEDIVSAARALMGEDD